MDFEEWMNVVILVWGKAIDILIKKQQKQCDKM